MSEICKSCGYEGDVHAYSCPYLIGGTMSSAHNSGIATVLHARGGFRIVDPFMTEAERVEAARSYFDRGDSATTFNPEEQFEKDNGL